MISMIRVNLFHHLKFIWLMRYLNSKFLFFSSIVAFPYLFRSNNFMFWKYGWWCPWISNFLLRPYYLTHTYSKVIISCLICLNPAGNIVSCCFSSIYSNTDSKLQCPILFCASIISSVFWMTDKSSNCSYNCTFYVIHYSGNIYFSFQ